MPNPECEQAIDSTIDVPTILIAENICKLLIKIVALRIELTRAKMNTLCSSIVAMELMWIVLYAVQQECLKVPHLE